MKAIVSTLALIFFMTTSQNAQDKRLAYSYLTTNFDKAIPEQMDKDKLSSKEEMLFKKFMKSLDRQSVIYFENYLTEKLSKKGYEMMPLTAVKVMSKSALNLDGYPSIFFPKKTIKKNMDKDVADYFISASLSIAKPIISVVGMKPSVTVTLKIFDNSGVLLNKASAVQKTEKKVSNLGFVANQKERFSKIDVSHASILFSKVEASIMKATDDALAQLGDDQ